MYFIEGNVGTGKSTFLRKLKELGINVIFEPVDEWTSIKNSNGRNLLEEFYNDQKRYAYTFQSIAFRTRVKNIQNSDTNSVVERSIFTDRNVFAKTCYENGMMNEIEWNDYTSWFDWLVETFDINPKGYIYLRTSPDISYDRIKKRNRSGEETIPFDYLKELHTKHEKWLMNEPNVLVLDVNDDFEENSGKLNDMIEKVMNFINSGVKDVFIP